ncbi:MAG: hypothetical protein RLZZ450_2542 [Pseudomonadota bacterium]|jgi:hypothetical protein
MRLTLALAGVLALTMSACDEPSVDDGPKSPPVTDGDDNASGDDGDDGEQTVPVKKDAGGTSSPNSGAKKDGSVAASGKDAGPARADAGQAAGGGDAGGPSEPEPGTPDVAEPTSGGDKPQLAVSADFLNQTLTVFNVDKMVEGASRKDVMVGQVDLSKYSPGPVALNITPDGKTALVSISGSFLSYFVDVPPGDGILLFVDLEKLEVVGELNTGKSPMGIVITPDGKKAFVGQLSENYFSYVDIEKRTFTKLNTGAQWNEELAIDDTGTVGILTYGTAGNAKTFSIADPTKSGQTRGLTGDAGGTAFFPGTKTAFLVQAPTLLTGNVGGHNVIDVTDPLKPVASDDVRVTAPSQYPCTAVHSRKTVVYPSYENKKAYLTEMRLEGNVATKAQQIEVGAAGNMPYGVSSTPDNRVLVAVPGDHYIGVVDLETKKAFTVPWEVTKSGPNDIKMIPKTP